MLIGLGRSLIDKQANLGGLFVLSVGYKLAVPTLH